jgi:hypothetical protein
MPGIAPVTENLLDNLIRATFRRAEFGFFGVVIKIFKQTPFFWGDFPKARVFHFLIFFFLFINNWFIVGISSISFFLLVRAN